jgi:hypothetical protein
MSGEAEGGRGVQRRVPGQQPGSRARLAADIMLVVHRCFPITPPPRS